MWLDIARIRGTALVTPLTRSLSRRSQPDAGAQTLAPLRSARRGSRTAQPARAREHARAAARSRGAHCAAACRERNLAATSRARCPRDHEPRRACRARAATTQPLCATLASAVLTDGPGPAQRRPGMPRRQKRDRKGGAGRPGRRGPGEADRAAGRGLGPGRFTAAGAAGRGRSTARPADAAAAQSMPGLNSCGFVPHRRRIRNKDANKRVRWLCLEWQGFCVGMDRNWSSVLALFILERL